MAIDNNDVETASGENELVFKRDPLEYWKKELHKTKTDQFVTKYYHGFLVIEQLPVQDAIEMLIRTIPTQSGIGPTIKLPPNLMPRLREDFGVVQIIKSNRNSFGDKITLGRAKNNDIVIRSDRISKVHCALTPIGKGHYEIQDMKSRNGTFLNGNKLEPNKPTKLNSGDQIGFWKFVFRYLNAADFVIFLTSQAKLP